jgi:hypothetical protein
MNDSESENFVSSMYEITHNTLLAFVDTTPQPILFGGKVTERLDKQYRCSASLRTRGAAETAATRTTTH